MEARTKQRQTAMITAYFIGGPLDGQNRDIQDCATYTVPIFSEPPAFRNPGTKVSELVVKHAYYKKKFFNPANSTYHFVFVQ